MITGTVFIQVELNVEVETEAELSRLTRKVIDQIKPIKGISSVEEVDSCLEDDGAENGPQD